MPDDADVPKPHNADWAWRPPLWSVPLPEPDVSVTSGRTEICNAATLFHDAEAADIILHRRHQAKPPIAYELGIEVGAFEGSFLSLALDLPEAATQGLKRTHILRVTSAVTLTPPITAFVRLNVRHGPNTEQLLRQIDTESSNVQVEFDLAYSEVNDRRIEGAWIDLIFEAPARTRILLQDLTVLRRRRAPM
ncbi:DUF6478 family protein [uncultured Roseobacter sp.]|uniref:DUF6478 family protein n=1 Tax=uncultured Roseobacter sp. TaxID=114847 RepID=UPI002635DA59|nr:DUF6478 family protein [uncultured Roseobacter sp.]